MKSDAVNSFFYIGIICRINGKLLFCVSFIYFITVLGPSIACRSRKRSNTRSESERYEDSQSHDQVLSCLIDIPHSQRYQTSCALKEREDGTSGRTLRSGRRTIVMRLPASDAAWIMLKE